MDKWTHRDRKLERRNEKKEYSKPFKKFNKNNKTNYKQELKTKYL